MQLVFRHFPDSSFSLLSSETPTNEVPSEHCRSCWIRPVVCAGLHSLALHGGKLLWSTWLSSCPRAKQLLVSSDPFMTNFYCLFSQGSVKAIPIPSVSSGLLAFVISLGNFSYSFLLEDIEESGRDQRWRFLSLWPLEKVTCLIQSSSVDSYDFSCVIKVTVKKKKRKVLFFTHKEWLTRRRAWQGNPVILSRFLLGDILS